jgi:hypothetical protein
MNVLYFFDQEDRAHETPSVGRVAIHFEVNDLGHCKFYDCKWLWMKLYIRIFHAMNLLRCVTTWEHL